MRLADQLGFEVEEGVMTQQDEHDAAPPRKYKRRDLVRVGPSHDEGPQTTWCWPPRAREAPDCYEGSGRSVR